MTNDVPGVIPEGDSSASAPVTAPAGVIVPPRKSKARWWIIGGLLVGMSALCIGLCVAIGGLAFANVWAESPRVTGVLDRFMTAMRLKDTDQAYALFSPRARTPEIKSNLQAMIHGSLYSLFDGYEAVSLTNISLRSGIMTGPQALTGSFADVEASACYTGGSLGRVTAVLEKINGTWMIFRIDVVVSPEKLQPSLGNTTPWASSGCSMDMPSD